MPCGAPLGEEILQQLSSLEPGSHVQNEVRKIVWSKLIKKILREHKTSQLQGPDVMLFLPRLLANMSAASSRFDPSRNIKGINHRS